MSMKNDASPESKRSSDGWTLQFTIEAGRAQEYIELYQSLGNEVHVRAVDPESLPDEDCSTCLKAASDRYVAIYTRPARVETAR
jgi:hypothetical protein